MAFYVLDSYEFCQVGIFSRFSIIMTEVTFDGEYKKVHINSHFFFSKICRKRLFLIPLFMCDHFTYCIVVTSLGCNNYSLHVCNQRYINLLCNISYV